MTSRPPRQVSPLDLTCPDCAAIAGQWCWTAARNARRRTPHAGRVQAARIASAPAIPPRVPGHVTDAWTCPVAGCGRSYWPPKEWEPELWREVLEAARRIHARRLRQEAIDAADIPVRRP